MDDVEQELRRALGGDEAAYRSLYALAAPRVRRLLTMFAELDPDEVEDALQETFIRAFRSLHRLKTSSAFFPWVLATARNTALTRLARRRKELQMNEQFTAEGEVPTVPLFPEALKAERNVAVVQELITRLPPGPERETVELFYVQGELSAREIAERLGVTKGAITMRLERFRARVKRQLLRNLLSAAVD